MICSNALSRDVIRRLKESTISTDITKTITQSVSNAPGPNAPKGSSEKICFEFISAGTIVDPSNQVHTHFMKLIANLKWSCLIEKVM